jgi:cobalamin biosynthetic protein CobC
MDHHNRDHGGDMDLGIARYGGLPDQWIDLSTGINRVPYRVPALPGEAWTSLPTSAAQARLLQVARAAYGTDAPMLAVAGAQAAIQMIPRLGRPGCARVLSPTYNEHTASLAAAGWTVQEVGSLDALEGAGLAVVVNPNNPDGRIHEPEAIMRLTGKVGRLVVDESFVDPVPHLSVAPKAGKAGMLVLRSFGKFYGLAGIRLGFVLGSAEDVANLAEMAGPWPVAGPAIAVGALALADHEWARATKLRLEVEAQRIDALAAQAGWRLVGGCALFRLYATPDARAAQDRLARSRIWARIFPHSAHWLRLGLPGSPSEWERLAGALTS